MSIRRIARAAALKVPRIRRYYEYATRLADDHQALLQEHAHQASQLEMLTSARDEVQSALNDTRAAFGSAQFDLDGTRAALEGTRAALGSAQFDLDGTRAALDGMRDALDGTRAALDGMRDALDGTRADLDSARTGLDAERVRAAALQDEVEASKLQVYVLRSDFNRSAVRVDELRSKLQAMEELRARQETLSQEIERLRQQSRMADADLKDRDQKLQVRGQELQVRGQELQERGQELQERDRKLQEQDQKLQEQDQKLQEQDQKLQERDQKLQERDQKLQEQHIQSTLATQRVQDLYSQLEAAMTWRAELDQSFTRLLGATSLLSFDLKGLRQILRADRPSDSDCGQSVELRQRYLDLLEDALVGNLSQDPSISPWASPGFDPETRKIGRDWPAVAQTMIGTVRMRNIRILTEQIIEERVAGDLIEAGVWRGGACIYMRGILAAHADVTRRVFVADSFAGLPEPSPNLYPADGNDTHHTMKELVVPLEEVKDNFVRFGLLDQQVVFLQGWFKDTLPCAPIDRLALLRLDGDMYSSTTETLEALYHKVSPGGFIIIDDYILPACRQAVEDFRTRLRIAETIHDIDGAGVFWRKSS